MISYSCSLLTRFRDGTKKLESGCWIWVGSKDKDGYGYIKEKGKLVYVHRLAYRLNKGEPGSFWVLHTCDNPPCVNPEHLFLGDVQDNVDDMIAKGRKITLKGDRSNLTLYPQSTRDGILGMKGKATQLVVSTTFGVSRSYVGLLWQGERRNG